MRTRADGKIGIDLKQALTELENATPRPESDDTETEHVFLALDKNVQGFPWESIPALRGRPVSRIPSLPFLLDQMKMAEHVNPNSAGNYPVNARKVFYILNPSGDLARTQTHFEPWITGMKDKAGWRGIEGRPPTELEMVNALKDNDLVLYVSECLLRKIHLTIFRFFGHGGAEQYIRSHKIKHLPNCATTFLWGCSSGMMKDQGDLDRSGTAWNYMMGGWYVIRTDA